MMRDRGVNHLSPPETKIALFRELFRGRDDVYPRRFETQKTNRFLAEDVGTHLDHVLDTILRTMANRKQRGHASKSEMS
jgi:hypothetical protein